ncbi:uncharacterized protein MKK02DRAFT_31493 [Dioszegia hungarica]|uniref:DNA-binding protein n=1 Tax=Dioszegia hungarica TaxID=4972 RepID=A0AA38HD71_9TREE|nr:uncharacterized protein MKK02DRAFT_31493 [Dioszegia hungarica]KAI9637957.1 hypothetical protein MKK02DRAFT_31493 [Dioszegia hungarica]
MTVEELEAFLKTEESQNTGQKKEDGEAIGHESGRKIVDILKRNPEKDPSKYTEEDQEHMRRVVSYCKRHLAQESHLKDEKTEEELEGMKSTLSLKNWGHDPLKSSAGADGGSNKPKSSGKPSSKKAPKKNDKEEEAASEKPASKSASKPASKKAEKPANKKDETKEAEKPKSKPAAKPASKKAEKPAAVEEDKDGEAEAEAEAEAEVGEKRGANKAEKKEKPAAKKAKVEKPVTEGTRKPPSRSAKKA